MNKTIPIYIYNQCKIALFLFLLFSVVTGILYPILVTGFAQILFPFQANGSLIIKNQHIVGSELIGQLFNDPKYFWGRPSATAPFPYNAVLSHGSNLGPTNPVWINLVKVRIENFRKSDLLNITPIPIELITASGSGLDPHITPIGVFYQIGRVSKARHLSETDLKSLVVQFIEKRQFSFLGEQRINVLKLNLALDMLSEKRPH